MSSLTKSTLAVSPASCSSTGLTARQGPHHGAQKSTTTGLSALRTSCSKLASVTSRIPMPRLQAPAQRPQPQLRDLPCRLGDDPLAHLRMPALAVAEGDRHLAD